MESIEPIAILLFTAAIVSMLARRMRLPYTVVLTLAGLALAFLPGAPTVHITRDLVFGAFLPPLIFEASLQMKWSEMKKELPVTATLATVGVLLSAAVVAVGAHYVLSWTWEAAVLAGVLISATDPVAVIAMFRDLRIGGRLKMRVEAESLFNDGTAAVLFMIALMWAQSGSVPAIPIVGLFLSTVIGGIVCGAVVAGLTLLLAGRTEDHLVEITFTTIAAFASFLIAEHFKVSGVLATMTAGIILGNVGSVGAFSDKGREAVESFWEYLAFVANSFVFLLIGMALAHQPFTSAWLPIVVVTLLVLLGRALAVYPCCALFTRSRHRVPFSHQHVLFWGGLRGALALALVLSLPEDLPSRQEILIVVFAVVAFSVLLQGLTIGPLVKKLGLRGGEPDVSSR